MKTKKQKGNKLGKKAIRKRRGQKLQMTRKVPTLGKN